eukprot:1656459-Pyramimonas_sp.AAC.1
MENCARKLDHKHPFVQDLFKSLTRFDEHAVRLAARIVKVSNLASVQKTKNHEQGPPIQLVNIGEDWPDSDSAEGSGPTRSTTTPTEPTLLGLTLTLPQRRRRRPSQLLPQPPRRSECAAARGSM